MGSRGGSIGGKAPESSSSLRAAWACLALCLLLLLSRCSPCEGRKLLAEAEEEGGKVMYFEGGLVLRVPPPPSVVGGGEEPAAVPRGFAATGRAARLMRSVPSPGVGH
ncbi:unnamed protein product [Miscanthus lutarioriparius]|uniref:Uncharacterized protein n=1 Tax=Miscanthus lutarioriparius TaxID=422564 RepID=A0A811RNX3_9POAL|nr:unnamed protein product [Miscanthus lutarioriparius]CAD6271492.1 unnamed protein product [Miscanthus lutarioriparius]